MSDVPDLRMIEAMREQQKGNRIAMVYKLSCDILCTQIKEYLIDSDVSPLMPIHALSSNAIMFAKIHLDNFDKWVEQQKEKDAINEK